MVMEAEQASLIISDYFYAVLTAVHVKIKVHPTNSAADVVYSWMPPGTD